MLKKAVWWEGSNLKKLHQPLESHSHSLDKCSTNIRTVVCSSQSGTKNSSAEGLVSIPQIVKTKRCPFHSFNSLKGCSRCQKGQKSVTICFQVLNFCDALFSRLIVNGELSNKNNEAVLLLFPKSGYENTSRRFIVPDTVSCCRYASNLSIASGRRINIFVWQFMTQQPAKWHVTDRYQGRVPHQTSSFEVCIFKSKCSSQKGT